MARNRKRSSSKPADEPAAEALSAEAQRQRAETEARRAIDREIGRAKRFQYFVLAALFVAIVVTVFLLPPSPEAQKLKQIWDESPGSIRVVVAWLPDTPFELLDADAAVPNDEGEAPSGVGEGAVAHSDLSWLADLLADGLVRVVVDEEPDERRTADAPAAELASHGAASASAAADAAPADWRIAPALAAEWSTSDDHRVATIRLRRGCRFHDDTPVTANDVAPLLGALPGVAAARAVDDLLVEVHLADPAPDFLSSAPFVRMKVFKRSPDGGFVGSGPLRLVSFERGQSVELTEFVGYAGAQVAFDQLTVRVVPTSGEQAAELLSLDADIAIGIDRETQAEMLRHEFLRWWDGPDATWMFGVRIADLPRTLPARYSGAGAPVDARSLRVTPLGEWGRGVVR